MKHFINIVNTLILINIIVFSALNIQSIQAQSVNFEYDAAGNMVQRGSALACISSPPEAPSFHSTNTNRTTITWYGSKNIKSIQYKKQGGAWQNINVTLEYIYLYNLENCQNYVARLAYTCDGSTRYTAGLSFSTIGCRLAAAEESVLIKVYPNPATNHINVQIDSQQNIQQLVIYNSSGQLVKQIEPQVGINNYPVEIVDLSAGVYLVKAHIGDKVVTEKFSVQ